MYDFCVIGGGIVGLATALSLQDAFPGCGLVVVEKEADVGRHQTGHNSGVIHSGIYYAPGSLKARAVPRGGAATKAFCAEHGIPFETCGKLLVATTPSRSSAWTPSRSGPALNGIEVRATRRRRAGAREPNVTGLGALFVPSTGIVDYRLVCAALRRLVRGRAAARSSSAPRSTSSPRPARGWRSDPASGRGRPSRLVACAGLQSDRVARLAGVDDRLPDRAVPRRVLPAAARRRHRRAP